MGLSDEELEAVHSCVYNEVHYGDDNIVYGSDGDTLRAALEGIEGEAKIRKLWWAR